MRHIDYAAIEEIFIMQAWTETEVNYLKANYCAMPIKEIAEIITRTPMEVIDKVDELNLPQKKTRSTPEERDKVVAMAKAGQSYNEIVKATQRSMIWVFSVCGTAGVKCKKGSGGGKRGKYTEAECERMLHLIANGYTIYEVAEDLGRTIAGVQAKLLKICGTNNPYWIRRQLREANTKW